MFCVNCGKDLPDDANFCLKCGRPQTANAALATPSAGVVRLACPACGSGLPVPPGDAEFVTCMYCRAGLQVRRAQGKIFLEESRWETCEILYVLEHQPTFGDSRVRYWTRAIGPQGEYNAGEEAFRCKWGFPSGNDLRSNTAHKALVTRLCQDGWEPIPSEKRTGRSGLEWWNDKFRRRVKSPTPALHG